MARVHVPNEVWAEFRRAAGNTPMSQILGRLVEREVQRDRTRRIRQGTVDDQLVLDALERARELHQDVAAIIDRLERRTAAPVPLSCDEPSQQEMDLPEW
jgi:hypothetical protein